jgi:hypothetical protein
MRAYGSTIRAPKSQSRDADSRGSAGSRRTLRIRDLLEQNLGIASTPVKSNAYHDTSKTHEGSPLH